VSEEPEKRNASYKKWVVAIIEVRDLVNCYGDFTADGFYLLDGQPAICARRDAPHEDLISHLLAQGYRDSEVLTECVTFGAAGLSFVTLPPKGCLGEIRALELIRLSSATFECRSG
jgi:hypothetical protein